MALPVSVHSTPNRSPPCIGMDDCPGRTSRKITSGRRHRSTFRAPGEGVLVASGCGGSGWTERADAAWLTCVLRRGKSRNANGLGRKRRLSASWTGSLGGMRELTTQPVVAHARPIVIDTVDSETFEYFRHVGLCVRASPTKRRD